MKREERIARAIRYMDSHILRLILPMAVLFFESFALGKALPYLGITFETLCHFIILLLAVILCLMVAIAMKWLLEVLIVKYLEKNRVTIEYELL